MTPSVGKELRPPFDSTVNYDAKCWEDFENFGVDDSIFINVGTDNKVLAMYKQVQDMPLKSQREWGDMSDLERGL